MALTTVDRNTTETELGKLYMDNCGYGESGDLAMATRFVTVCRAMMRRGMTGFESAGGTKETFAPSVLQQEIREAKGAAA